MTYNAANHQGEVKIYWHSMCSTLKSTIKYSVKLIFLLLYGLQSWKKIISPSKVIKYNGYAIEY